MTFWLRESRDLGIVGSVEGLDAGLLLPPLCCGGREEAWWCLSHVYLTAIAMTTTIKNKMSMAIKIALTRAAAMKSTLFCFVLFYLYRTFWITASWSSA